MPKASKIETLYQLLAEERRKIVAIAAESGTLPPSGLLTYLADLDGATLAVEAVLEERHLMQTAAPASVAVN